LAWEKVVKVEHYCLKEVQIWRFGLHYLRSKSEDLDSSGAKDLDNSNAGVQIFRFGHLMEKLSEHEFAIFTNIC
jgi:hypothetical protein